MDDFALMGWEQIAKVFPFSERKVRSLRKELRSCGAIFYVVRGTPPRRRVCAFEDELRTWIRLKSAKGEDI